MSDLIWHVYIGTRIYIATPRKLLFDCNKFPIEKDRIAVTDATKGAGGTGISSASPKSVTFYERSFVFSPFASCICLFVVCQYTFCSSPLFSAYFPSALPCSFHCNFMLLTNSSLSGLLSTVAWRVQGAASGFSSILIP